MLQGGTNYKRGGVGVHCALAVLQGKRVGVRVINYMYKTRDGTFSLLYLLHVVYLVFYALTQEMILLLRGGGGSLPGVLDCPASLKFHS